MQTLIGSFLFGDLLWPAKSLISPELREIVMSSKELFEKRFALKEVFAFKEVCFKKFKIMKS